MGRPQIPPATFSYRSEAGKFEVQTWPPTPLPKLTCKGNILEQRRKRKGKKASW